MATSRKPSNTNAITEEQLDSSPRLTILNLLRAAKVELETLYSDTYEAMAIRQSYASCVRDINSVIKSVEKIEKVQTIRKTPCYVREGTKIRKMTVDELLRSLDDEGFRDI